MTRIIYFCYLLLRPSESTKYKNEFTNDRENYVSLLTGQIGWLASVAYSEIEQNRLENSDLIRHRRMRNKTAIAFSQLMASV
ncbi:hypothetical protein T4B_6796 [Trichinella pseudospiralis]|uniref:Uncharacterized protein n=1 Tax=Trichinella pseudospiralis TaxID=6337 RepID=A0A0V1JGF4_TRIPS|nr:hypothetical protein T4B_6796 [Trichinella pseudospiralis]